MDLNFLGCGSDVYKRQATEFLTRLFSHKNHLYGKDGMVVINDTAGVKALEELLTAKPVSYTHLICLTTMLLVIISTVGNGVIHLQKSQAAGSYGSNYGCLLYTSRCV